MPRGEGIHEFFAPVSSVNDLVVVVDKRYCRLSRGIDDAYAEWLLGRTAQSSEAELERQLRSPRSPGGHAPQSFSDPQP